MCIGSNLLSRVEGPGIFQVWNQLSNWGKLKALNKVSIKRVLGPGPR